MYIILFCIGGGSRKGSRSNTPIIIEETTVGTKSPQQQQEHPQHQPHAHQPHSQQQQQQDVPNGGDVMHRTQPTVIEPMDPDLPGFNIDDFIGDIIGYPG